MEIPLNYLVEFSKSDIIDLKLITETPDKLIFKETKVHYDLETNEKSKLLIYIELTQMTDKERRHELMRTIEFKSPTEDVTKITQQPDDKI